LQRNKTYKEVTENSDASES